MSLRIFSGGQTGVDRGALDVAMDLGLEVGGWCTWGRRAEDGKIPEKYPLQEADTSDYQSRTVANVRDSSATLVLYRGDITPGSALTLRIAMKLGRPHHSVNLAGAQNIKIRLARKWLEDRLATFAVGLKTQFVLNVAGSRESSAPGIYEEAKAFLRELLEP